MVSRAENSVSSRGRVSCGFGDSASLTLSAPASGFVSSGLPGGATGDICAISFSISARLRQKMRKAWSNSTECSCRFTKTEWSVQ